MISVPAGNHPICSVALFSLQPQSSWYRRFVSSSRIDSEICSRQCPICKQ